MQPTDSLHSVFIYTYATEFSFIGTIASIIGLLLSAYVFITARRINQFIFYNRRLPQLQRKIDVHASSISKYLNDFDSTKDSIRDEMIRCSANLKALRKRTPRQQKKIIDSLFSLISDSTDNNKLNKESARQVYLKLQYLIEDIQNLQKDYEMEK